MRALLALCCAFAVVAGACATGRTDPRPTVVVGFYPLAEATQRIAGDRVRVVNLTPPGAEPHDLELTTTQASEVLEADLVLLLGRGFQPAVERFAKGGTHGETIELLRRLPISRDNDPHIWLDPVLMKAIASEVTIALDRIDRASAARFERRASAYERALERLNRRYDRGLASCRRRVIVTAHAAFGYLARRYRLEQHAITGVSPEAEPDPATLSRLAALVRRDGVTTIFTETLVSSRVAHTLAREAHVKTAVLDPIEGLTADERKAGDDYVKIMDRNLAVLRKALDCS
jgi:zinc transport system substrate-binding protein